MYLKKLIGAFTALIMTVTVFAGSAVTVSAYSEENGQGKFPLDIKHNETKWDGYADTTEEFNKFINGSGYTFEHDEVTYIVTGSNFKFENYTPSAEVTVSEAVTLSISGITERATVNVISDMVGSYTDTGDYVTAKGATVDISIKAPSGQQIKSVTINGEEQSIDANATMWVDTYTMNTDATLGVTFAGTHSINVSSPENGKINVSHTTAKAGDNVTVYIDPDNGYELANLSVTYGENQPVNVEGSGNARTFTMPEGDVTVTATFKGLLPEVVDAIHIEDYDNGVEEYNVSGASLWEGTLKARNFAFNPVVEVELKNGSKENAVGTMVISGENSIIIDVVVDRMYKDIEKVQLSGKDQSTAIEADNGINWISKEVE